MARWTTVALTVARTVALTLATALGGAPALAADPAPPGPPPARETRAAIERAIGYMISRQAPSGLVGDQHQVGATSLAALCLMASGRHVSSDPPLATMLDRLALANTDNTYERGLRANVWEYALRQVPGDPRTLELLRADLAWLLGALGDRPGWRYSHGSRDWDNSCTQYGVLGVWAAVRAGLEPPEGFWSRLSAHFRACQNPDGGWGYMQGRGSTPNMATAGLASLFLVFDQHYTREPYRRAAPERFTAGEAAEVLAALDRAQGWLAECSQPWSDGYFLYGLERCGVASGERRLGGVDWYAKGARTILAAQRADGSIPIGGYGGATVNTAFCTLFLLYGGAPLAFYELDHRPDQDDDRNPRDLANLTRDLWPAYERTVNWQRVTLGASLEDLLEAPVVFLSGTEPVSIDADGVAKLRDYVLSGGTLLAEPSDHAPAFARSIEALLGRMFPADDYPGRRFEALGPEHPVYAGEAFDELPRLRGAGDGSRTFFYLSEGYLAADWQAGRRGGDALRLARSLLFSIRGDRGLRERWSTVVPPTPPELPTDPPLVLGRVVHGEDGPQPRDWDPAPTAWRLCAPYLRHVTGADVKTRAVRLGQDALDGVDLLHLTGRRSLVLDPEERAALVRYVRAGGTLLVDAFWGEPAFAASARAALEELFGPLRPLAPRAELALGPFPGGGDLSAGLQLQDAAFARVLDAGGHPDAQQLLVARVDGRPAGIFSGLDLCAAMAGIEGPGSAGYTPDSARRVVANVVGYVLSRPR